MTFFWEPLTEGARAEETCRGCIGGTFGSELHWDMKPIVRERVLVLTSLGIATLLHTNI
jgi:hypothetical protein